MITNKQNTNDMNNALLLSGLASDSQVKRGFEMGYSVEEQLALLFNGAKSDLNFSWSTATREDRIARNFIYSIDPSHMDYLNTIWKMLPGWYSKIDAAFLIMETASFAELQKCFAA